MFEGGMYWTAIGRPLTLETMQAPALGLTVIPTTVRGRTGGYVPSFSKTNNLWDISSPKLIVYKSSLASTVTDVGLEVGVNVGSTVLGSDVVGLDDGDEVGVDVTGFKVGGIVG